MSRNYKKLEKLYSKIPELECKGLCHESCSIIPAAKIEIKRAKSRMGGKNPFNPFNAISDLKEKKIPPCGALKDKKCSIYNIRPVICRLYGVAEGLECPFGCSPKATINKKETYDLIKEIEAL